MAEIVVPMLTLGSRAVAAGLTDSGCCTRVGAGFGIGCGAGLNAGKHPLRSSALINLDGGTVVKASSAAVVAQSARVNLCKRV